MLPDEIVSEILSPALKVPDDLFSDTSETSPFANFTPSTSAYLLVCKDWLRVATPLLYSVVVLRSKAQATALAAVLKDNPEFGRFIKKLRVEGGYGPSMHAILKSAPNITDLFLSLTIWSSDNTSGLCKGLPLINPHRFITVDPWNSHPMKNKQADALRKSVLECIPLWNNLRIFCYPYPSHIIFGGPIWVQRAMELSQTLVGSHVQTIIFSSTFSSIPRFIPPLYGIPSLEVLQFQPSLGVDSRFVSVINGDPRLKRLAKYEMKDSHQEPVLNEPIIAPSLNPHFRPMDSASEQTRETVWKRVLFFAMYVELFGSPLRRRPNASLYPSRLPILCVSKYFHRLALPYLHESVKITPRNAVKFREALDNQPLLGSFIRRLFTASEPFVPKSSSGKQDIQDAVLGAFQCAHHLEVFVPVPGCARQHFSTEAFELLAKTAGRSLQELTISLDTSISASMFEAFSALRTLDIGGWNLTAERLDSPSHALKSLHTLKIGLDFSGSPGAILAVFEDMGLESLHSLGFPEHSKAASPLVKAHGAKLLHLTMEYASDFPALRLCPNLVDLELTGPWNFTDLAPSNPHNSLTKIVASNMPTDMDEDKFNQEMFPALREIQIRSLHWPTTERDIVKSKFVPFAEYLLEKNVKLTSRDGKAWVPRLKLKTGRGRK
ncbi:hypothetical protein FB45DRAFT_820677 [Roridomyces roridus]|uniref:Uncharacterized protein n=1 Tax=Roridomyces roridus TaxID=1738132 RepID=A0AAD7CKT5_9AGAR|nr:hypothetical protein FB45DRAFT_820677 [Roridomyces roridus]